MNQLSAQRAIKAALSGNWDEAIEFNLQLLKNLPADIEALNRLARAYAAIGQTKNAAKTWHKVLRLDPYNPIALGQLEKLKNRGSTAESTHQTAGNIFLDEPGKTKTAPLVRLADSKLIAGLQSGQKVNIVPKNHLVTITNQTGDYIGSLPDDLSAKIKRLIRGGNKYAALIRRVEKNTVFVFIKEVKRSKRYHDTPSFTSAKTALVSFEPSGSINHTPIDIAPTGEELDSEM